MSELRNVPARYDRNLDYLSNPNYNKFAVWASFTTDEERSAYLAWLAAKSAAAQQS